METSAGEGQNALAESYQDAPDDNTLQQEEPTAIGKKKRAKKKPKSKRGKNKPTGFEEYYVDTPMTPEEYETEKDIYNVSRPLIHRIEDALLRYQSNRRILNDRREIFIKYLSYGGVDVGQKMFEGSDGRDLQQMDKDDILLARGQTSINHDYSRLEVDFNAVVKGYLTSYFPYYFNPENEDMIKLATVTIRNFLSYLLYHDVCPEYKDNIEEARKSCDIATVELWKNQQLTASGPGDFNTACATLFGGLQHELYVKDNQWAGSKDGPVQMPWDTAQKVTRFGSACAGSDELATQFHILASQGKLEARRVEDIDGFEVTEVRMPDSATCELYREHAPDLHPVGSLTGRAYRDPGKPGYDLSPEERQEWEQGHALMQEFEFFLEDELLHHCYPGMKVITSIWELNCGLHYFEDVITAYASIYTVLANDLIIGWKKPKGLKMEEGDEVASENEASNEAKEGLEGNKEAVEVGDGYSTYL